MSNIPERAGTLILSVGGSPEPLRHSIASRPWARVVFVVSEATGGGASSRGQVEDAEIVYNKEKGTRGPGLRHLPECPRDVGIVAVPPDDLDRALALVDGCLAREVGQGRAVTVNYTGGTKTMTAALVLAGAAYDGVRLEFVSGQRPDLVQVRAGSEHITEMPRHLLGAANLFALARAQAGRRAYGAALGIVDEIGRLFGAVPSGGAEPPASWRQRQQTWRDWLAVLEGWDRFAFAEAARTLAHGLARKAPWAQALENEGVGPRLRALAEEVKTGPGPALCEDLWLNAQRRAELGLYDDAIARLYRLAEAGVQARLNRLHRIADTGAVPRGMVPEDIAAGCSLRRDPKTGAETVALPLYRALLLLRQLDPGDVLAKVWPCDDRGFATPEWQRQRNHSILAHGFRPATEEDWKKARAWFEARRGPFWEELLGRATAPQLPDRLP
ncbi:CRISPR-associated protein family [Rubellimicrobium thermophilum DSM 16684]|uniref:CRISPR-associated protein family n=1 Tax=Rubellimicrobium thermophilum DSM 16684 TaxID=1123069 RepID=S9SDM1_9RHOB|nr:TIGR02710 family CRISPR-associated CARF protein [Rubellimicrobium thermophilum]EPX84344.1 CRISPR-associated protein family [Rubellimicrobium thermophilum DSM 16684]